ncbi:MAG: hypothetical protein RSF70_09830 [Ruthenibacterium sp.]
MASKKIPKEDIVRLFDLCLQVNALGKDTVFFEYAAHVCGVFIRVYLGGWTDEKEWPDEKLEFYTDGRYCEPSSKMHFTHCITYLEGLLHE